MLAGLLAGCGTRPAAVSDAPNAAAPPLAQALADLPSGRLYRIDAAQSAVRIHVFRAGRAAQLGHNHVLAVPALDGFVWLPAEGLVGARCELEFRLDELELDRPEWRAALGPGWASRVSPEAIAATRANMLGDAHLQAARFPSVRLRSLQISGELPKLALQLEVALHGQRQQVWLPLQIELDAAQLHASGSLVLRQSDFGITPFSVFGGLLAVRDELLIEFALQAQISPSKGSTSTQSPAATEP